jgi:phytoene synthase
MSIDTHNDAYVAVTDAVIASGYKNCVAACRKYFSSYAWMTSNLPAAKRNAIAALGWHLMRCVDLLDLESFDGLSLDIWREELSNLDDTFKGHCRCAQDAALVDAVKRFGIPKEHLFEMFTAADAWIRTRKFETFDQMDLFAAKFGGSMMAACAPVFDVGTRDHFEQSLACGQAIQLTQLLANLVPNLKRRQSFFCTQDVKHTGLSVTRTMMRQSSSELKRFVRLQTSRIEKRFLIGGQLVPMLDFDGQRTLKSMLDYWWAVFSKLRADPDCLLQPGGILRQREKLKLRTRHLMGVEGKSPVIP